MNSDIDPRIIERIRNRYAMIELSDEEIAIIAKGIWAEAERLNVAFLDLAKTVMEETVEPIVKRLSPVLDKIDELRKQRAHDH